MIGEDIEEETEIIEGVTDAIEEIEIIVKSNKAKVAVIEAEVETRGKNMGIEEETPQMRDDPR